MNNTAWWIIIFILILLILSNSDLFKGWCVIEVSERSGINKALINKSGHGGKL